MQNPQFLVQLIFGNIRTITNSERIVQKTICS